MYKQYQLGWIEVITGCMFAGKTEELIKRIRVLEYAKQKIYVFKPSLDNRYRSDEIASHAGSHYQCYVLQNDLSPIKDIISNPNVDVVVIDEVQFFNEEIVSICEQLANAKKRVIVAGLDTDFRGEPFPVVASLMAKAEFVTKLSAVCNQCGAPATRTQRLINGKPAHYHDPIILVGAKECYEARCRSCHCVIHDQEKNKCLALVFLMYNDGSECCIIFDLLYF